MSIDATTIKQAFPAGMAEVAGRRMIGKLAKLSGATQAFNSGALAIKAGGSAVVKTTATVLGLSSGALVTEAAGDMAALVGTVTNAAFNVYVFSVTAAGVVASQMGTEGATLAAVKFPVIATGSIVIGFVIINPTGTGNFVGGTSVLDDGTIVPNAVYVNTPFQFDPAA